MINDLTAIHARLSGGLEQRRREAQPRVVTETFHNRKHVRQPDGQLALEDVATPLDVVLTAENRRPTRFRRNELSPLETLESFFGGGWAWENLPDHAIWEASLAFLRECNTERPGRLLSLLAPFNTTIALGLLARAGAVETKPWQVPTH